MNGLASIRWKIYLPCEFPLLKGVKVSLEEFAVVRCLEWSIDEVVVSKMSSNRIRGG